MQRYERSSLCCIFFLLGKSICPPSSIFGNDAVGPKTACFSYLQATIDVGRKWHFRCFVMHFLFLLTALSINSSYSLSFTKGRFLKFLTSSSSFTHHLPYNLKTGASLPKSEVNQGRLSTVRGILISVNLYKIYRPSSAKVSI